MEVKNEILPGYKKWNCQNGRTYCAKENSCIFCAHCTDIFWDYTNGPYMFICDADRTLKTDLKENASILKERD